MNLMKIIQNLISKKFTILFSILLLCYLGIGTYLIFHVPVTADEPAHLSAAQSYSQGQGLNPEHPPLLKFINSLVLQVVFPNLYSQDDNQWSRSWNFLYSKEYRLENILRVSRFVYLIFNSLIIIWLAFYTLRFKLIPLYPSIILTILYIFSPSFYSHNFLITFDVASANTLLGTLLSITLVIINLEKFSSRQFWFHSSLAALWLTACLGTKFSNSIVAPFILIFLVVLLVYYSLKKQYLWLKRVVIFACVLGFLSTLILGSIFTWSFRNINKPLIENVNEVKTSQNRDIINFSRKLPKPANLYLEGAMMTKLRSTDSSDNFLTDHYEVITFKQLILRVFWFKENPILVLMIILIIFINSILITRLVFNTKRLAWFIKFLMPKGIWLNFQETFNAVNKWTLKNFNYIISASFIVLYPVLFLNLSGGSYLTIGYRHFYPILLLIYLAISVFFYYTAKLLETENLNAKNIKQYFQSFLLHFFTVHTSVFIVILYIIFGFYGVSANIGYVNFLWQKESWRLANDSTVYWGQNTHFAWEFLINKKHILDFEESVVISSNWHYLKGSLVSPQREIYIITGQNVLDKKTEKLFDVSIDPRHTLIQSQTQKYLIADHVTFQHASDEAKKGNITAKQNLDFLISKKPIFNYNDTTFVYEIR